MKNKKVITILISLSIVIFIVALILCIFINRKPKYEVIDATIYCDNNPEVFYEDEMYKYIFPCTQSTSTFISFPEENNKVLVVTALKEKKITIKEFIKAARKINLKIEKEALK